MESCGRRFATDRVLPCLPPTTGTAGRPSGPGILRERNTSRRRMRRRGRTCLHLPSPFRTFHTMRWKPAANGSGGGDPSFTVESAAIPARRICRSVRNCHTRLTRGWRMCPPHVSTASIGASGRRLRANGDEHPARGGPPPGPRRLAPSPGGRRSAGACAGAQGLRPMTSQRPLYELVSISVVIAINS
jgi:hypothetical protein